MLKLGTVALVALFSLSPPIEQDVAALKREIEQLKAQQAAMQKDLDAIKSFLQQLIGQAQEPKIVDASVAIAGEPAKGSPTAKVTLIEVSDYHCPFCRRVQPTLMSLLDKYKGQVRLVYKHLPLDGLHPQARRVSEASWCADKQDKFWAFHDAVYADTSSDASDATLTRFASAAGLDTAAFTACLASPETKAAIQRDVAQGEALGLNSTPGFFINGREIRGAQPLEAFVAIIDEELRGARR